VYQDTGGATQYKRTAVDAFLGAYVYFDAIYAELSAGIAGSAVNGSQTNIQLGLLLKYPVELNSFTLFPLLGAEYEMVTAKENGYGNKYGSQYYSDYGYKNGVETTKKVALSDWSTLWIKLGFGFDIPISQKSFLRGEYLFGIAPVLNKWYKNIYEEYYASSSRTQYDYMINYTHTVRFSVGLRL
jgi:hypothetical protein